MADKSKIKRIGILTAGGDSLPDSTPPSAASARPRSAFMAWRFSAFATAFAASWKTGG